MAFTKLKAKATGLRTRVDLSKVALFNEGTEGQGTELVFDTGFALVVEESFQTVSNRAASGDAVDAEPVAAPVTGL